MKLVLDDMEGVKYFKSYSSCSEVYSEWEPGASKQEACKVQWMFGEDVLEAATIFLFHGDRRVFIFRSCNEISSFGIPTLFLDTANMNENLGKHDARDGMV